MKWISDFYAKLTWDNFYASLTWSNVLLTVGLLIVSFVVSTLIVAIVMVRIPANYFSATHAREFLPNSSWHVRWGALILKNLAGVLLILIGIVMSLPGVPGPGFVVILLGLVMMDIPGKRPLEARIIQRPAVLNTINSLRARYNKPPLILD
jgi:hypothetical protein